MLERLRRSTLIIALAGSCASADEEPPAVHPPPGSGPPAPTPMTPTSPPSTTTNPGDDDPVLCDSFRTVVAAASEEHPRNTEGDVLALADGRLLLAFTQFNSTSDHGQARILGVVSDDGGRRWSSPVVLAENDQGRQNAMIASLTRLDDGAIMLGYNKQTSLGDSRFYVRVSDDETETWSDEVLVIPVPRYGFVYNFAPLQLSSSRILAPYMFNLDGPYVAPG
ncbi:MAG: sialidase family protein, partial [Myxococcota bacterium]